MKLSNLVNYKMELEQLSALTIKKTADIEIEKITYLAGSQAIQLGEFANILDNQRQNIQQAFDSFEHQLTHLKRELQALIEITEKPWFVESYRLYEQEMIYETSEAILSRRPILSKEVEQFYQNRIVKYNSWKHPAMIIRPGEESWINDLVASDPLYLVDESHDLLAPAVSTFNELYQQRLRTYVVNERTGEPILNKLPDGQFGFALAYNLFNFRPFEVIRRYLTEIHAKLRPGGVLALTFNDCDRDKGVMLAEQHYCCYTPGNLVKELAKSLGYEVIFSWNDGGPSTWLELQKPGEFESLRGGQALAKIIPKPIAESK